MLRKEGQISLDQWAAHDKWYRNSCSHSGYLVDRRLGNIGLVAHVREFLQRNSPNDLPLLLERVVSSGAHCGDWVAASDVPQLLTETRRLQAVTSDPLILQFTNDVTALARPVSQPAIQLSFDRSASLFNNLIASKQP
jgi:hypothetical protein